MMPMYKKDNFINPVSYDFYKKGINLPSGYNLTIEDVSYICKTIKELIQECQVILENAKN
jgi:dTDP-4-amino-4,6-dideoxygalactose transaminase